MAMPSLSLKTSARAGQWRAFQATKTYDIMAATPLIAWYALSGMQLSAAFGGTLAQASLRNLDLHASAKILAQGAGILFIFLAMALLVLRRPAIARARGFAPKIAALAGTFLGVAVVWLPPRDLGTAWSLMSMALICAGVLFSVLALAFLGRSFSLMAEARRLVTGGPYGVVRHPLYLGEAVSMLGLALQYLSPLALAIVTLQLAFQLMRMTNEEQILAEQFPEYEAYAARVARIIPGIY